MKRGWRLAGCIARGVLFLVLFGGVTMVLWNWLVPVLFAGPVINFWQAIGLLALTKILFSGMGKGHSHHQAHHGGSHWKTRFYEKFSNMTPEERDTLKQRMKEKWCSRGSSASTPKSDGSSN